MTRTVKKARGGSAVCVPTMAGSTFNNAHDCIFFLIVATSSTVFIRKLTPIYSYITEKFLKYNLNIDRAISF